jgi:TRAP-type mannitol/chloroaromatic compound transport system permease large subunit
MAAYYLKGVAPDWPLGKIYRGMMEFMVLQVIGLTVVLLFPDLVLWLPRVLFGAK